MIRLYNHTAYHHRSPWPSAGDGSMIRLYNHTVRRHLSARGVVHWDANILAPAPCAA